MPDPILTLRRTNASRASGSWQDEDYGVFNGEREVGRIYQVTDHPESRWFWGVSFHVTRRKSYGYADTLDEAKDAFRAEYEDWLRARQN